MDATELLLIVREANFAGQGRLRSAGKLAAAKRIAQRVQDEQLATHLEAIASLLQRADPEVLGSWLVGWGWGRHSLLTREFERRTAARHRKLLKHAEAMRTLLDEQRVDEGTFLWFYFPGKLVRGPLREILRRLKAWESRELYVPLPGNEGTMAVEPAWPALSEQSVLHQRAAARPLLAYLRRIGLSKTTQAPLAAAVLLWYSGLLGEPEDEPPDDLLSVLTERVRSWEKPAR